MNIMRPCDFFWYTKNIKDAREGWFMSTLIAANFHYIMIYVMNKRDFSEEFTIAKTKHLILL